MKRRRVPRSFYNGGRKRIFIGLLCVSCLLICLLLFASLILPWLAHEPGKLRYLSIILGVLGITGFAWICLILVLHIYTGRNFPGVGSVRHAMIRILLPMMEIIGKYFGVSKGVVRRSFVKVNNEFVAANASPLLPEQILLLLPHCIQASACPHRLIYSLANCADCGRCQIGALRAAARRHGFNMAIATGGTIARRIVEEFHPAAIVAVACERDLTSGIQDCYPIPVFGVLNSRPHGPCRDTLAPDRELGLALAIFLGSDNCHIFTHGQKR